MFTMIAHLVWSSGGKVTEHPIREVKKEEIVDTNGAGDCFVGGMYCFHDIGQIAVWI